MESTNATSGPRRIPEGYIPIPIAEDQESSILKICVLVRPQPDPVGGHLVELRNTIDARILLGCIIDASTQVLDWLELRVQNSGALVNTPAASRLSLSNSVLDDRWHRQFHAFADLDETTIVRTGFESSYPLPTLIDLSTALPVHPMDSASGAPWKLCTDESLLQQNGLPSYSGSLHRYLYVPESGSKSRFVPVTREAPTNRSTRPLSEILGEPDNLIPFNPGAGLMLVRKYFPIGLETFIDILSGGASDGSRQGRLVADLGEYLNVLGKDDTTLTVGGRLFLETHGRGGRLVETFHLKLRLLADIVCSVHSLVRHLQRPLLNISPDTWQVTLSEPGHGLPLLWTARAVLSDPGDAITVPIGRSEFQYFLPACAGETSVYRPLISSLTTRGCASVRIRWVLPDTGDTTIIEGTFTARERVNTARHDLVWFRLGLACGDINLYAHLESDSAMATGEWRFRTIAQHMSEAEISNLRAAEGVPIPEAPFEIIPLLSSPSDLYSLAVMAGRILLVDDTNSIPVVLDEMLSLARQIEIDYDESTRLEERIENTFQRDKRWPESLGPHHLISDNMTPDDAFGVIPSGLWWTTLAIIVRMLPGLGPDSECRDYGDAQPGGLQKIFERTIADLDHLLLRTRSLIVADWESNQEICAVIKKYLT